MSCDYCRLRGYLPLHGDPKDVDLVVDPFDSSLTVELHPTMLGEEHTYMTWADINYCPMCGESLREEGE